MSCPSCQQRSTRLLPGIRSDARAASSRSTLAFCLLANGFAETGGDSSAYDTGIAASSLMFGGVMDAFPKLEVMLPHAGGTFPSLIGRMTHGSAVRPETKHMTKPPVAYLRRFYYDTISHNEQIMLNIIRQVGADRVVMGSDHPADMSTERPVDFVERIPDLSTYERELILGGNAARLLKI